MTDKQIKDGIDGLSCANCPDIKRCREQQAKKEYAINQVLQDIPSEYADVIARLKKIIPSITRCDYVLEKQLKRKEQEHENLNKKLDIALRNNANITHLKLDKVDLQDELDQLKAENETLFKAIEEVNKINKRLKAENEQLKEQLELNTANAVVIDMTQRLYKLKQTLNEIKEITERCGKRIPLFEIDEIAEDLKQILQKISEVTNE